MHASHKMFDICTNRQSAQHTMPHEKDKARAEMLELSLHTQSNHSPIGYDGAGASYAGGTFNQAPGLDTKDTGKPCRDRCEPTLQKMYTELVVLGVHRAFWEAVVVGSSILALTGGLKGLSLACTVGSLSVVRICQGFNTIWPSICWKLSCRLTVDRQVFLNCLYYHCCVPDPLPTQDRHPGYGGLF